MFFSGRGFIQIIINQTIFIVIWYSRRAYRSVVMITLPLSLAVLIDLSTYTTYSSDAVVFTSTLPTLSVTFSNFMSINITRTINSPRPYNVISLFTVLLIFCLYNLLHVKLLQALFYLLI